MKADETRRGMSLVEVTIVIVVLGVIMAGVFMMFISGTEHFEFARRQNELDMDARMILDRVSNEIIWAGYMPVGGWDNDEWHPITKATADSMSFFADLDESASLE
ncbi:MAG TPA: type II secretion system protein, partial [Candidatus Fermentibacter sp.]|nr:type II secretion system protein [Candidatus Fermentibacter sp.]